MTILLIILLVILGTVLLLLEFAVIPGFTVAGLGGIGLLGYSIYLAYTNYGIWAAVITTLLLLILIPLLFFRLMKSKTGRAMQLETEIDGVVKNVDTGLFKPGDQGRTIGRLAPMGKVEINKIVFEAKSTGEYIPHDTPVEIIKIRDNQIIVKQID